MMPSKSSDRMVSKMLGRNHYVGKICEKHPDEQGVRYTTSSECTRCAINKVTAYRATPRGRANVLSNSRRRSYGITQKQFDELLASQGGQCDVCRTDNAGGRDGTWHLDHDHKTGKHRGVLCARCNVGLGHFRDNLVLVWQAVAYLERHA